MAHDDNAARELEQRFLERSHRIDLITCGAHARCGSDAGGELGWAELGEANVCSAVPACAESRSVCCHGIASGGATAGVPKVAASKPCDVLAVPGTGEGSTWKKPDCGAS